MPHSFEEGVLVRGGGEVIFPVVLVLGDSCPEANDSHVVIQIMYVDSQTFWTEVGHIVKA